MSVDRRQFLHSLAAAAVASQSITTFAQLTKEEALGVAVVGTGGRGKQLIGAIQRSQGGRLVAVSDADQDRLAGVEASDKTILRARDFRKLLDHDSVDVIAIASPNHWHALMTLWACQAGKHVYVEKPISHNVAESRAVVAASDRWAPLIQCGFQNRSDAGLQAFFRALHAGKFGKILSVHGTCHRQRESIGKLSEPQTPPASVDYNLWLGPAPEHPIYRPKLHYDWHWDFNTGNGDIGNQGVHEWDLIQWALGDPTELPVSLTVAGNRFGWNDAGDTPNVLACATVIANTPVCFEVMNLAPGRDAPQAMKVGVLIHTDQGTFSGGRRGGYFRTHDGEELRFAGSPEQNRDRTVMHLDNFFDAIRQNDRSILRSDCRTAATSSSLAHAVNIAYLCGKESDPATMEHAFSQNVAQRDMLARMRESPWVYAAKHKNGSPEPWILGAQLRYDNAAHIFTGPTSDEANRRLSRKYRSGFEMPKVF